MAADNDGVHVVWASENEGGQSQVFVRSSDDLGETWEDAHVIDGNADGHQWFPDIASDGETLTAIYYDSAGDLGYSPDRPPGNDADGVNSGDVVHAVVAQSSDGVAWTPTTASSAGSNFGWETNGSRRVGFWGDYLYVSAVPGAVNIAWTDSRDLVPGDDPRETDDADDEDGFDVFQDGCV